MPTKQSDTQPLSSMQRLRAMLAGAVEEWISDRASSYGAAGSVIALLLWVYYSAQIFFLGVELTRQYALWFGSLRNRQPELVRPGID